MDKLPDDTPMENPPPLAGLNPADLLAQGAAGDTIGSPSAFQPPTLEEMAVIIPKFEILELIGKGGMGAVYKVRQKELDRIVALKILPPAIGQSPAFSERFAREARALAKLNHPGIVTLHEFGQADGLYFILMEFVDGVNLAQLMRTGRISPREALAIVPQICDALQFAHDHGIVHRDIKPENLLLDRHGRVKVADFGIAKVVASVCENPNRSDGTPAPTDQTLAGNLMGTPQYMAPEQIEHPADVDHRADIYALGVVFYQMLTGELPGKDLQAPSRKVQIDVRLDEIVLKAMEKNPEHRYQQASVMRTRVDELQSPKVASGAPNVPPPPKRDPFGRWWWVFLVMIPLGLLAGFAAGTAWTYLAPKTYEVSTTIEVHRSEGGRMMFTSRFFETQHEIILSRKSLAGVATQLDLSNKWMLDEPSVVPRLKKMIRVQNIRGTDLISISLRHTGKQEAVTILDAVLANYQRNSPGTVIVHEHPSERLVTTSPDVRLIFIASTLGGLLLSPLVAFLLILALQRLFPGPTHTQGTIEPRIEPRVHRPTHIDSFAISSLVLSIILGPLGSIPAIIFGHISLSRIKGNPSLTGRGFALAGLVIGYLFLAGTLLALLVAAILFGVAPIPKQTHSAVFPREIIIAERDPTSTSFSESNSAEQPPAEAAAVPLSKADELIELEIKAIQEWATNLESDPTQSLDQLTDIGEHQLLLETAEVVSAGDLPKENRLQVRKVAQNDDPNAELMEMQVKADGLKEMLRVSREVIVWDRHIEETSIASVENDHRLDITLNKVGGARISCGWPDQVSPRRAEPAGKFVSDLGLEKQGSSLGTAQGFPRLAAGTSSG